MPVTKTITLYKFEELDEAAQEKAITQLYDINVDYDWWNLTYEDANNVGLEIQEFDLDNRKHIDGKLTQSLIDCCQLIRANHGKECETFKTARQYLKNYAVAFSMWKEENKDDEDCSHWSPRDWLEEFKWTDEADEVTNDFRKALLEDYLIMLKNEYEYLTSTVAIKETIEANEYLFLPNGKLYSY